MDEIVHRPSQLAPATLADQLSTASQHQFVLDEWASGRPSEMLPVEVTKQIGAEVSSVLAQTCSANQAATAFARLMACYPQPIRGGQEAADAYSAIMMEEMQRFPLPVLRQVLPEFYRSHPFPPSVGEFCPACEEVMSKLYRISRGLDRMEGVRAEQQAENDRVRNSRENDAVRMAEFDRRACAQFGADGVLPGDFAAADRTFRMIQGHSSGSGSAWMKWFQLVRSGEWPAWMGASIRTAGIFGRAELALRRGQATLDQLGEVRHALLSAGAAAAREALVDLEQNPVLHAVDNVDAIHPVPGPIARMVENFRALVIEPAPELEAEPGPVRDAYEEPARDDSEPGSGPNAGRRHLDDWTRYKHPVRGQASRHGGV